MSDYSKQNPVNKKTGKLFVLILDISIKLYDSSDHAPTVMITPIKVKNNSLLLVFTSFFNYCTFNYNY